MIYTHKKSGWVFKVQWSSRHKKYWTRVPPRTGTLVLGKSETECRDQAFELADKTCAALWHRWLHGLHGW